MTQSQGHKTDGKPGGSQGHDPEVAYPFSLSLIPSPTLHGLLALL
jgi:hypothetical protein